MNFKRFVPAFVTLCLGMLLALSFNVKADESSYGKSDIDRIYIQCDTAINSLTKSSYSAAEITVVKADGSIDVQDAEGQVKLRGNSTSTAEKKPVNIKFSSKQSVLGMDKGKKWCVLANAFDKSLIRNALYFDLAEKFGLDYTGQRRFIDLYYNGELQGSYLVTEPVDPGANLVDIEEEDSTDFMIELERERYESDVTYFTTNNGVRFAINVPEEPSSQQAETIKSTVNNIESAMKSYDYNRYSQYIDVDSFVDFYIVSVIFKQVDFNYSSTRFYMKDNVLYAGPVWDADLSSGNASSQYYSGYYENGVSYKKIFIDENKWFGYLLKSSTFVDMVRDRLYEMLPTIQNMYETNILGTNVIDGLMADYEKSFLRNYESKSDGGAGWSLLYRYSLCVDSKKGLEYESPASTYEGNVEMLRTWLANRVEYLLSEYDAPNDYTGLYGSYDIERLYINCETDITSLTKASYTSAQVFTVNKDGSIDIQDLEAQVKLRGNSTSKAAKKPVNIKLSSKQSIFGMDKGKKWCILANAFDKTLIRNALCFDLADKLGLNYISQRKFVDLFYNGEYLGSYLITEPVDPGSNLVDIEEEGDDFMIEVERERNEEDVTYLTTKNGIRFAINVPEEPTNEQYTAITSKVAEIENAIRTSKYSEYSKYIDVDSFVNYYIVSEIFKAVDFNYSSTRFYLKDGILYAGPVWDVDLSSGNASNEFYKEYYEDGVSYKQLFCTELKWYGYLFKSDEFISLVNKRFAEVLPIVNNMYVTNSLGTNQIDILMESYKPSFLRNYASVDNGGAGWDITYRYSTCDNKKGLEYHAHPDSYEANVELLRSWLTNRVNYLQTEWSNRSNSNNVISNMKAEKYSSNKIELSWYQKGNADGVEIYVKAPGGKYKLYTTLVGKNDECVVRNLKPGIKYTFKVVSFVDFGNDKLYSEEQIIKKKIKLKSPKKVKTKVSGKKAKVTWKKVFGVDGYIIYSVKKNGKLKKVAKVKGAKKVKYTIKNPNATKYTVKAFVKVNGKQIVSK